jgi:hypothetical protein
VCVCGVICKIQFNWAAAAEARDVRDQTEQVITALTTSYELQMCINAFEFSCRGKHSVILQNSCNCRYYVVCVRIWKETVLSCFLTLARILKLGIRLGGCSASRPARFTSGRHTLYPLYRRLGGPQSRSGRGDEEKIPWHCRESNPGYPVRSAVTIPTELPRLLFTWLN